VKIESSRELVARSIEVFVVERMTVLKVGHANWRGMGCH
jgi:hypothetical protein